MKPYAAVKTIYLMAILAVLTLVVTTAPGTHAQQITGRVLGTVLDSSGSAVPNAQITLTNQATGVVQTTVSGTDGLYNLPEVSAGTYTVESKADGFSPAQVKDVVVTVGTDSRVDLKMQVGSVTQTVTVTEAVPLVNTTSDSVGSTVDEQKVSDLPLNGRNWTDLTLLQPGVTQVKVLLGATTGAGFNGTFYSSNGGAMRSNAVLLDGASEKNLVGLNNSSMTNTSLGVDGIQEYKVVTNLFSAEYGLSMGSQTTIVSKGGTNQFHGDAFEYLRNSSLDSRNYFDALDTDNANGFGTDKSPVYPGKRIPPFRRNNFGGSVGGPIQKDKTFFYGVYEGIRQALGVTITLNTLPKACFVNTGGVLQATVPAAISNNVTAVAVGGTAPNPYGACVAGGPPTISVNPVVQPLTALFPQPDVTEPTFNYTYPYIEPTSENWGQMRIDHTFSASDTAFFRWTQDDADQLSNYTNYEPFRVALHSGTTFVTLGENHVFTPTLLNTARFSFSRTWDTVVNSINQSAPNAPGSLLLVANQIFGPGKELFGSVSPGSGVTGAASDIAPELYGQNIYSLSDDIFWTKGKHAFKFGTLFNYYYDDPNVSLDAAGGLSFPNLTGFFAGNYSSITVLSPTSTNIHDFRYITDGYYAQDDYRLSRRITLNLGLRYEFATVPIEANPALRYSIRNVLTDVAPTPGPIFANPTWHNFSPRVGFAWDVFGNGQTSVRGGAGLYYDVGNYGGLMINNVLSTPPISTLVTISTVGGALPFPLTIPLPGNLANVNPVSPRTTDYNFHAPSMLQHSLIIDQQLPWAMGLSIGYVGSRGMHYTQQEEGNPTVAIGTNPALYNTPIWGCWNAAGAVLPATTTGPTAGSCPATYTLTGPRTNEAWGQTIVNQGAGDAYYNSLQIQLTKRVTQGLQFQLAYTLSKLIDDGEEVVQTESTEVIQAPFNERDDRGPAVFDSPQNLRATMIYHLPTIKSEGVAGKFANGWWISSIVSAQSGYPFSPQTSLDRALENASQINERVSLGPNFNAHQDIIGSVKEWFDPTEFYIQPAGNLGTAGRDILRGPGFEDVDFSLVKDTKAAFLGEAGSVEFRAEVFNLLNHPNFALPNATVWSGGSGGTAQSAPAGEITATPGTMLSQLATAGQITSTVGNDRQIQFALKLIF